MSIDKIIIYIMVAFAVLGAVDRIIGNRFGLGEKFEEGIMAIGSLALSMVGIIALAPVIANLLEPVVVPVFNFLGLAVIVTSAITVLTAGTSTGATDKSCS